MKIDELTIGEAKELARVFGGQGGDFRLAAEGEQIIVVLQRGWVVVGTYSQSGETSTISNAKIIRRWGTTKGLGELAEKGPLPNTVLDSCPPVRFHVREAVFAMEVNDDAWRK